MLNQKAIESLNMRLKLPATGQEQDWEIELSDAERIQEFIDTYGMGQFSNDEKRALFALILSSIEESCPSANAEKAFEPVAHIIAVETAILSDIIAYWKNHFQQPYE